LRKTDLDIHTHVLNDDDPDSGESLHTGNILMHYVHPEHVVDSVC